MGVAIDLQSRSPTRALPADVEGSVWWTLPATALTASELVSLFKEFHDLRLSLRFKNVLKLAPWGYFFTGSQSHERYYASCFRDTDPQRAADA